EIGDKVAANHEGYIIQDQSHYVLLSATSLWTRYFGGTSAKRRPQCLPACDPLRHRRARNPAAQQSLVCYFFRSEAREVLSSETARVHHAARRRGGMAGRGGGAATGDAGHRLPEPHIA